jgi:transposase InsO family protein
MVTGGLQWDSDQGVQYASYDYVDYHKKHKMLISISRKGNPYDNAFVESFIKTLKVEEVYLNEYRTLMMHIGIYGVLLKRCTIRRDYIHLWATDLLSSLRWGSL